MATPGITTSPEVLSAASRCPYIQQVVANVGDPQVVSNSLAPFMSLATVVTGAPGAPAPAPEAAQPSTSASTPAIAGASGGEVAEEAVTASTAGTDEKPADKKPVE